MAYPAHSRHIDRHRVPSTDPFACLWPWSESQLRHLVPGEGWPASSPRRCNFVRAAAHI